MQGSVRLNSDMTQSRSESRATGASGGTFGAIADAALAKARALAGLGIHATLSARHRLQPFAPSVPQQMEQG